MIYFESEFIMKQSNVYKLHFVKRKRSMCYKIRALVITKNYVVGFLF